MRYIVLSFDDGRKDTYRNAIPIMLENNMRATINITTDFIEFPNNYELFPAVIERAMTIENILEIYKEGFEIANHGAHHKNTLEDIEKANKKLKDWGIDISNIGFASPYSEINEKNINKIIEGLNKGEIKYIRSGIQIRRKSLVYKMLYLINQIIKNSFLFYYLNKDNIFTFCESKFFFKSITINKNVTFKQIKNLIEKMPNNTCIIFNFHSILRNFETGYNDTWVWDLNEFKKLCQYLSKQKELKVIKTIEILKKIKEEKK